MTEKLKGGAKSLLDNKGCRGYLNMEKGSARIDMEKDKAEARLEKIKEAAMQQCSLADFMEGLKPWLSSEYIRKAYIDEQGNFVVNFVDGVKNVYRIEDCSGEQLKEVLKDFEAKGIPVAGKE